MSIAAESGLTNYQVGRILSGYLPAPTYYDITALCGAADLSPNDAASIANLYREGADDTLYARSAYELRVLNLLRRPGLSTAQRVLLAQAIEAMVLGLEGHDLLVIDATDDARSSSDDWESIGFMNLIDAIRDTSRPDGSKSPHK